MRFLLLPVVLLFVFVGVAMADCPTTKKDLPVPHYHQVFGVNHWYADKDGKDRTFVSPVSGEAKDIRYASCWPAAIADVLAYYKAVLNNRDVASAAIKSLYDEVADHDDGAHTGDVPKYLEAHYPGKFYAKKLMTEPLKKWPSETKAKIIRACIDQGWPVMVSVNWVARPSAHKIFPHALVIRGYELKGGKFTTIVNDPAGSYTMTGKWDSAISGEGLRYSYDDYYDRYMLIIVPAKDKAKLDQLLGQFCPLSE